MATSYSSVPDRVASRRAATRSEVLDHAERIMTEDGAGAVTVVEIARRMGMRSPSVYKYFPSLHAIYDALFARGNIRLNDEVAEAVADCEPGLDSLRHGARAYARWIVAHHGFAALLVWHPIPGFTPSPESYAAAREMWQRTRDELAAATGRGELSAAADSDDATGLLTSLVSGICSQQLANEPGAPFDSGRFTSLLDDALAMFVGHYATPANRSRP